MSPAVPGRRVAFIPLWEAVSCAWGSCFAPSTRLGSDEPGHLRSEIATTCLRLWQLTSSPTYPTPRCMTLFPCALEPCLPIPSHFAHFFPGRVSTEQRQPILKHELCSATGIPHHFIWAPLSLCIVGHNYLPLLRTFSVVSYLLHPSLSNQPALMNSEMIREVVQITTSPSPIHLLLCQELCPWQQCLH